MILILGGTTEGRIAVKVADEAGKPYFYSTKGEWQEIQCKHGIRITGGMNTEKMESFCRQNDIRLLVDAAHPFASQLHRTVDETSRTLHLPVIRFERKYPPRTENIIWCEDYTDAIYRLEKAGTDHLLALTGDHREVTPLLGETYLLVPRTGTGNFHHISPRTRLPERKSGILSCRRIRSSFIRDTTSTSHSDQGKRRIRRIFGESESGTGCKNPGLCYKTPSPSPTFHDRYR